MICVSCKSVKCHLGPEQAFVQMDNVIFFCCELCLLRILAYIVCDVVRAALPCTSGTSMLPAGRPRGTTETAQCMQQDCHCHKPCMAPQDRSNMRHGCGRLTPKLHWAGRQGVGGTYGALHDQTCRSGVPNRAALPLYAAGQDDPEWTAEKELCMRRGLPYTAPGQKENAGPAAGPEHQAAEAAAIPVGSRCEVDPGAKRGVVRCTRLTPFYVVSAMRWAAARVYN